MTERSPSETTAASDENAPDVDTLFDLLSNARRRGVLYAVKRDGAATVDELARRVAAWQRDGRGTADPSPEQVRTSLVHAHLPRLDDADVIDYDGEAGTVELADADGLEPLLHAAGESTPSPTGTDRHSSLAD